MRTNLTKTTILAFSLIEIVISIGVVSFVMVSLVGLTAVGMNTLTDSKNDTATAMIFSDIRERMIGKAMVPTSPGSPMLFFYDRSGVYLNQNNPDDVVSNFYRVEVSIGLTALQPIETHPDSIMAAVASIYWPVDTAVNGNLGVAGRAINNKTATFLLTSGTGPKWRTVSPTFAPLVAF